MKVRCICYEQCRKREAYCLWVVWWKIQSLKLAATSSTEDTTLLWAICRVGSRVAQFEHAPAIDVIKRYDSPETLFYCDPPYVHDSRTDSNAYAYEMTDAEHRKLAQVLHTVRGKVALSGYHCDLMEELYSDWHRIEAPIKLCHSTKQPRQEILWANYELAENLECLSQQLQQTSLKHLLNEPLAVWADSAVSQPLKETFLALRFAAESAEENENDSEDSWKALIDVPWHLLCITYVFECDTMQ